MVSAVAGREIQMPIDETWFRNHQQKSGGKLVAKRTPTLYGDERGRAVVMTMWRREIHPKVARMDKIAISYFVSRLAESNDVFAKALQKIEVRYEKGGIAEITQYIDEGYEVGVSMPDPGPRGFRDEGGHICHIGRDREGRLIDLSDTDEIKEGVEWIIQNNKFDEGVHDFQKKSGGWNLILMKQAHNK